MEDKLHLSAGDLVVRHGKILKVFKINPSTIELKPFFDFKGNNGLTFTLNKESLNDGHIRPLVPKAKIKALLNLIIKKSTDKTQSPVFDPKTALSNNLFEETLWIIKLLWLEKKKNSNVLPNGKLTMFRRAMLQATEEIAVTNNTSLEKAEALILTNLDSA